MTPTESKTALVPATEGDARRDALLRALGFDRLNEGQRELALAISTAYDLDPMLRHVVMVDGKPYITRDGLLHVAHKSGDFDGIEVDPPTLDADGKYWRTICRVYRKSFSRPFIYPGRYPAVGGNAKYNEEMAIKVAEVMTLRRAFDVSAPVIEERWDGDMEDVPEQSAPTSLAERVAQRALAAGASAGQPETGANTESDATLATPDAPVPLAETVAAIEAEEAAFIEAVAAATEPDEEDEIDTANLDAAASLRDDPIEEDVPDEDEPVTFKMTPIATAASTMESVAEARATSPLREPEPVVPAVEGQTPLDAFKAWAKGHNTTLIRTVARELFPNLSGFSELNPQELGVIQHEVTKAEARQADAAATERCGAGSPTSNNKCTLDPGHKGVHRHGTREAWANEG